MGEKIAQGGPIPPPQKKIENHAPGDGLGGGEIYTPESKIRR